MTRASLRKTVVAARSSGLRTSLMAISRPMCSSKATITRPMPPRPSSPRME
ncbi:MAG: hypothetical protein QM765_45585 [Myxococcales bacterium]